MVTQLSKLRNELGMDSSDYVRGAKEAADAAVKAGQATDRLGESVKQAERKLADGAAGLERLRRAVDPLHASQQRLTQGTALLNRALENGKVGPAEHARLLGLLNDRYDQTGKAARRTSEAVNDNARVMEALRGGVHGLSGNLGVAGDALAAFGTRGLVVAGVIGGIAAAVGVLGEQMLTAGGEFQKLQASLRTVGGSAQLAAAEFDLLKQFALETPMTVADATAAFIKLKALGLDPSMAALKSYGNTAGALGKTLQDMVEAVADATTGEFERLKEFGIKASAEGNKVTMTFQGVKTTIANNASEIQKYLLAIGNTKFATGMAEQANTLDGALDSLKDNWQIFMANLSESGPIQVATALIRALADAVSGLNSYLFPTLDKQVADTRAEIAVLRKELEETRAMPIVYAPHVKEIQAEIAQREKALEGLEKESDARKKLIADSKAKAAADEVVDKKAAAAAAKEAERRGDLINKMGNEWSERTRLLDATRAGEQAVRDLNRELAGERAVLELLGVTSAKEAWQLMENNKALAEQAMRARQLARDNYDLKEATEDVAEAQKKAAKEAADAHRKFVDDVKQTSEKISTDVAESIYDGMTGKGADLLDWFKSLFKRIAVEALAANVILPITTQIVGSMPGAFGIGTPNVAGANGQSLAGGGGTDWGGMANSAYSIFSGSGGSQMALGSGSVGSTGMFSGMTSGINGFGASAFGMAPGTVAAAPSAAFVGPMPMATGSSSMLGGSTMMGAVGGGFAGAAAGGMIGSMVGNATQSKVIGAGAGALSGAAIGFMVGGPVGAAVGAIGGALMAALGTAGKPSNKEGNATMDLATGRTTIGGQEGKKFSQENRDAAGKAVEGMGGIAGMLGGFSGRQVTGGIMVAMGDRDGMSARMGLAKRSFDRDEKGMAEMTKWFVSEFAAQLGQDLPAEIRIALQHVDWRDVEGALKDVNFAGNFRDAIKALGGGLGLIDQASASAKAEVEALTANFREFRATTARLGLDTAAANDATRSYVEGLLGMREAAPAMTQVETAVELLKVRFGAMGPLLKEVGIHADEATRGLERQVAVMREQFIKQLDRESEELSGLGFINKIGDAFELTKVRMRDAAALGGGTEQVLRNNHLAMMNIMKDLSDGELKIAADRFGEGIAAIANALLSARASGATAGDAAFDVAAWLKGLQRRNRDLSGLGWIDEIDDSFAALGKNMEIAARSGQGMNESLQVNHLTITGILGKLSDEQLVEASRHFGDNIALIADGLIRARAASGGASGIADWVLGMERETRAQPGGESWMDEITDRFRQLDGNMARAAVAGRGAAEALTLNHVAMVGILEKLSDTQLRRAAEVFGGGIAAIADGLLQARASMADANATMSDLVARTQQSLTAANEAVASARAAVQEAYQREIATQSELAASARATRDEMARFEKGFRDFADQLKLGDLSTLSPEGRYTAAKQQFEDVATRAAAGDPNAMAQLQESASTFLQQSRGFNASGEDYSRDFDRVQSVLATAASSARTAAETAERQLAAAERQTGLLQSQLDAATGTKTATLSVLDAVRQLTAAVTAQSQAAAAAAAATAAQQAQQQQQAPTTATAQQTITAAYQTYLHRDPDASDMQQWMGQFATGASLASITQSIAGSDEAWLYSEYMTVLGRPPDSSGQDTWGQQLTSGAMTRAQVHAEIIASPEAKARGFAAGGLVALPKVAGGMVEGGTWNMDSVMVPLAGGEFVTRAPSVNGGTLSALSHINRTGKMPPAANSDAVAELRAIREEMHNLVRVTAAAGDENGAGLAMLDKRLATVERRARLAGAA